MFLGVADDAAALFRRLVIVVAGAASILAVSLWVTSDPALWVAMDYRFFYGASERAVGHLYDGRNFTFVYPPTAIFFPRLLALSSFWVGFIGLTVASVMAFYVALSAGWVARLSLVSVPALQGLIWGQVSMLLASGLVAALRLPPWWRGLLIGAILSIKPQLFVAAPFVFLVRRDWRTVAGIMFGGLINALLATALFGFRPWIDWLAALGQFHGFLVSHHALGGAISPAGIAEWWGLPPLPFLLLGLAAAAWLATRKFDDPLMLAAQIGGASILASPYAMVHDAIVLVPAAVSMLLTGRKIAPAAALYASALHFPPAVPAAALLLLVKPTSFDSKKGRRALEFYSRAEGKSPGRPGSAPW